MPKMLSVATVLAVLAVFALAAQPNNASNQKQQGTAQGQPSTHTANGVDEKRNSDAGQSKTSADSPHWYTTLKKRDWWVVIVAGLTGCVVGWQSFETRKSADAAFRQVQLQVHGMQQWVEVRVTNVADTGHVQDPNTGDLLASPYIEISIEAINQTGFPLTVEGIGLLVNVAGTEEDFVFRSDQGRRLIPGQRKSSSIGYRMRFDLNAGAMTAHRSGQLAFVISGHLRFAPSIGPVELQAFDLFAKIGGSETAEFPYLVEMRQVEET